MVILAFSLFNEYQVATMQYVTCGSEMIAGSFLCLKRFIVVLVGVYVCVSNVL